MTAWLDPSDLVEGLRGTTVHVFPVGREAEIRRALANSGFSLHALEGRSVCDDASFFRQVKRAFRFGPHFGKNWDALGDALGDLAGARSRRVALLWLDAHRSLAEDAQTVIDALLTFSRAAEDLAAEQPPTQLEVFLLGEGPAFGGGGPSR
jgi:RNAse (barnase) inhibitor barstar